MVRREAGALIWLDQLKLAHSAHFWTYICNRFFGVAFGSGDEL
jgi:hypothetical protein